MFFWSAQQVLVKQFTQTPNVVYDLDLLTEREKEVCFLVADGLSNKEIADKVFLGEGTVKNHITKALSKLELRDRTQLAIHVLKSKKWQKSWSKCDLG